MECLAATPTPQSLHDLCTVELPEMSGNGWAIRKVVIDAEAAKADQMRAMFSHSRRYVRPGSYTQLVRATGSGWSEIVMSDTPDERRDHYEFFWAAKGRVLVHGLGLGMVIRPVLSKPEVEHLTVVEIDAGLIDLVAPFYQERWGDRLTVICDDALTWQPPKGARWDVVWHDIWPSICSDNLPQMHRLHRRFAKRCDWQGSWARDLCERGRWR